MNILEHLDAETSIEELLKLSPELSTELEQQSVALQILGLYSIARDLTQETMDAFVENSRKYAQGLVDIGVVKSNLAAVDSTHSGVMLPQSEKYIYEYTCDMVQFYQWLAGLTPTELRFVISSVADNAAFARDHTDIIEVINDSLAKKATNPVAGYVAVMQSGWLHIIWAAPTHSTLHSAWSLRALDVLFRY